MSTNDQVKHQDREDIVDNSLKDQLDKIIANYAQRAEKIANHLVGTQRAANVKRSYAQYIEKIDNRLVGAQRAAKVKGKYVLRVGKIANRLVSTQRAVNEEIEPLFKERLEKMVVAKHMSSYNKNVMGYVANTQGEMVRAIAIGSKTQSMLNDKYKDITLDIEI
jgi:hypothetical protein